MFNGKVVEALKWDEIIDNHVYLVEAFDTDPPRQGRSSRGSASSGAAGLVSSSGNI